MRVLLFDLFWQEFCIFNNKRLSLLCVHLNQRSSLTFINLRDMNRE
jgi:hypothetical protein